MRTCPKPTDPAEAERRSSFFGAPPRADSRRPWRYDSKPMVSIGWQEADRVDASE